MFSVPIVKEADSLYGYVRLAQGTFCKGDT